MWIPGPPGTQDLAEAGRTVPRKLQRECGPVTPESHTSGPKAGTGQISVLQPHQEPHTGATIRMSDIKAQKGLCRQGWQAAQGQGALCDGSQRPLEVPLSQDGL